METMKRLYETIDTYFHFELLNEDINTFEKFLAAHKEYPESTIEMLLDIIENYEPF